MKSVLFVIAAIVAVGLAGITIDLSMQQQASAESCNQRDSGTGGEGTCHGCQFRSQGYDSSNGKCHHHND
jgi:hypothetical protein